MGFDAGSLTAHMKLDNSEFMDAADEVEQREEDLRQDVTVPVSMDKAQWDEDDDALGAEKEAAAEPVVVPVEGNKDGLDATLAEVEADRIEQAADPIVIPVVTSSATSGQAQMAARDLATTWQAAIASEMAGKPTIAEQLLGLGVTPEQAASVSIGPSTVASMRSFAQQNAVLAERAAQLSPAMASAAETSGMSWGNIFGQNSFLAGQDAFSGMLMRQGTLGEPGAEASMLNWGSLFSQSALANGTGLATPFAGEQLSMTGLGQGPVWSDLIASGEQTSRDLSSFSGELENVTNETNRIASEGDKLARVMSDAQMGLKGTGGYSAGSLLTGDGGGGGILGGAFKTLALGMAAPVAGAFGTALGGAIAGTLIGGAGLLIGAGTSYEAYKVVSAAGGAATTRKNALATQAQLFATQKAEYGPGSAYYTQTMANAAAGNTSGLSASITAGNKWTSAQSSHTAAIAAADAALSAAHSVYGPGGSNPNYKSWVAAQESHSAAIARANATLSADQASFGPGTAYYQAHLAQATAKNKTIMQPSEWTSVQAQNTAAIEKINRQYTLSTAGLPPGTVKAATTVRSEMDGLAKQFDAARQSAIPGVVSFLGSLAKAAPSIMPFVNASTGVFSTFLGDMSRGMQSPGFKAFMGNMATDVKPIMGQFATWTENVGMTAGKALELFGGGPANAVGSWADRTSARLNKAFGAPAVKGHWDSTMPGEKQWIPGTPATGFFKDINVKAMDSTFDAIGHVVGLTLRAIGRLLIAAEPAGAAVGTLVGGLDKLVLALPKKFETDLIEIAITMGTLKKLLPFIGADFFRMKDGAIAFNTEALATQGILIVAAADILLAYEGIKDFQAWEHARQAASTATNYAKSSNMAQATKDYQTGNTGAMTALSRAVAERASTMPVGQDRNNMQAQAEYFAWAANQMTAGKKIGNFGQFSQSNSTQQYKINPAALTGTGNPSLLIPKGGVVVHVYVDGKELTNTVVKVVNKQTAGQVARMHSGKVLG